MHTHTQTHRERKSCKWNEIMNCKLKISLKNHTVWFTASIDSLLMVDSKQQISDFHCIRRMNGPLFFTCLVDVCCKCWLETTAAFSYQRVELLYNNRCDTGIEMWVEGYNICVCVCRWVIEHARFYRNKIVPSVSHKWFMLLLSMYKCRMHYALCYLLRCTLYFHFASIIVNTFQTCTKNQPNWVPKPPPHHTHSYRMPYSNSCL